jgi:hypothetical protein
MKRLVKLIPMLILLVVVAAPVLANAAGKKAKGEVVMKVGSKVNLFHSGKASAQSEIAIGDVLPVYRQTTKPEQEKKVGEIKVLGFEGEHYFKAEIVKGEVKVGDIAKKEKTGLLVQPAK